MPNEIINKKDDRLGNSISVEGISNDVANVFQIDSNDIYNSLVEDNNNNNQAVIDEIIIFQNNFHSMGYTLPIILCTFRARAAARHMTYPMASSF